MLVRERGIVQQVTSGGAVVKVEKIPAHQRCQSCGICQAGSSGWELEVEAPLGLAPGAEVVLELDLPSPLKSVMLVFLFPLLALLLGVALGEGLRNWLWDDTGPVLLTGFVALLFLAGAFFLVHLYDRKARKKQARARIVETMSADKACC